MCFWFGSKPKPQGVPLKTNEGPDHEGGNDFGVWTVQPVRPEPSYQYNCVQNHVREKKFDDNFGKKSPPSSPKWDYSESDKGRKPKKSSACDQKFTASEATAKVIQSPSWNSDSDSPLAKNTREFKQQQPSTPEKYMMNSCEEEWNTTEYTKPGKPSSDEKKDRKSEGTKHADYPQQQTVDSDSETRRTTPERTKHADYPQQQTVDSDSETRRTTPERTKHADYPQQQTVNSDSETRRTTRARNYNEEE